MGVRTILIAEDEPKQRKLLAGFLRRNGWDVREAADGVEAVEGVRDGQVALVLLDQHMPKLGGCDAIRALRAADPAVEVVVVTAYGDDTEAAAARAAGAADYLHKPLDLDQLQDVIHRALAHHASGA
jgi:CheY-like chemotaxis protein